MAHTIEPRRGPACDSCEGPLPPDHAVVRYGSMRFCGQECFEKGPRAFKGRTVAKAPAAAQEATEKPPAARGETLGDPDE